jgi:hypothetical protein
MSSWANSYRGLANEVTLRAAQAANLSENFSYRHGIWFVAILLLTNLQS